MYKFVPDCSFVLWSISFRLMYHKISASLLRFNHLIPLQLHTKVWMGLFRNSIHIWSTFSHRSAKLEGIPSFQSLLGWLHECSTSYSHGIHLSQTWQFFWRSIFLFANKCHKHTKKHILFLLLFALALSPPSWLSGRTPRHTRPSHRTTQSSTSAHLNFLVTALSKIFFSSKMCNLILKSVVLKLSNFDWTIYIFN